MPGCQSCILTVSLRGRSGRGLDDIVEGVLERAQHGLVPLLGGPHSGPYGGTGGDMAWHTFITAPWQGAPSTGLLANRETQQVPLNKSQHAYLEKTLESRSDAQEC